MKKEERWPMYFSIHRMKKQGLNQSQVKRNLGVSRNTVIKFWNMSVDEYKLFLDGLDCRSKKLDPFKDRIIGWLREYADLSAAQVLDWLKEHNGDLQVAESTVRNYVRWIRKEYDIPKVMTVRDYEAVESLPMGSQLQVDFGETKLKNLQGHLVKLWFITFVLSHSRHKYALWQDRPFTTADVVQAHEQAFAFYGGMPAEIVYDQDHLLLTSENHGDLIFTHEFGKYVEERKFRIYMCRKQDPESKGKIENVVKYIKRNFARHRSFTNVDKLNEECLAWLHRTGNAKVHQTTKKIPAEVHAIEKAYLRPVTKKIEITSSSSITRAVRKDNTIWYEANRYTVPLGTYSGTGNVVGVRATDENRLLIYEIETGELLADHDLCLHKKGELIRIYDHGRDRTKGIDTYVTHVVAQFVNPDQARVFLEEIRKRNRRYIRDQLQAIEKGIAQTSTQAADKALAYCSKHHLFRATDFVNAARHFQSLQPQLVEKPAPSDLQLLTPTDVAKLKVRPQIRDFHTYERILGGKSP